MALSTSPTRDEVYAAYAANVGYDVDNDVAAGREFVKACRLLLSPRFSIKRSSHGLSRGGGGEEVELDQKLIENQLAAALTWLASNDDTFAPPLGGGGVVHPDFAGFRD